MLDPLGLGDEIFVGPARRAARARRRHARAAPRTGRPGRRSEENNAAFRRRGRAGRRRLRDRARHGRLLPDAAAGGTLNGARLLSPRIVAPRDAQPDRGAGRRRHGDADAPRPRPARARDDRRRIRGLGTIASPRTFGHGGVGSSYCWADPDSGLSFAYLTEQPRPRPVAQPAAGRRSATPRTRPSRPGAERAEPGAGFPRWQACESCAIMTRAKGKKDKT